MFGTGLTNPSSDLRDVRKVEGRGVGLYSRIHLCFLYFLFFLIFAVTSGFGTECEQLNEGAEEGIQPALVGHALLHHFLLAGVFSCLFNGVGLGRGGRRGIHTYSVSRIMGENDVP